LGTFSTGFSLLLFTAALKSNSALSFFGLIWLLKVVGVGAQVFAYPARLIFDFFSSPAGFAQFSFSAEASDSQISSETERDV